MEQVFQLIYDYIPYDIIDKYYDFDKSFHILHKSAEYEAYHYLMKLNSWGEEVNQSGEKYFEDRFAFKTIHRNDNDWIAEINYLD